MSETALECALIEKLARRVVEKYRHPVARDWLRDAVRMRDIELQIRRAIRSALKARDTQA